MSSTVKVSNVVHPSSTSDNITLASDGSVAIIGGNLSPYTGMRNRIINGSMTIDQRNAGASVTPTNAAYTLDRWSALQPVASKFSVQQNAGAVTPPVGFVNYLGVTSLSAYSVLSSDAFAMVQRIEGTNVSDLGWGTANAQAVTLSFWVRSSLTGTFGGSFRNSDANRSYPFTYTISAANTWEQKTVTIAGDTSGTWLTTNGIGINIFFGLGVGSTVSSTAGAWAAGNFLSATGATSVVGTNGATFYITGVQLEKGSTATPFEFRSIGQELGLCQRYYYKLFPGVVAANLGIGGHGGSTASQGETIFPVTMRTAPAALEQSGTANQYATTIIGTSAPACSSVPTFLRANVQSAVSQFTVASGLTQGQATFLRTDGTNGANAFLAWSAEL
jgi:hypothetical protein